MKQADSIEAANYMRFMLDSDKSMRLRDIRIKLKLKTTMNLQAFRLRQFLRRKFGRKRRKRVAQNNLSWMTPVSHGYQVVKNNSSEHGCDGSDRDSMAVQREQIGDTELWFFGVFAHGIGDKVIKYVQTNLFDRYTKESKIWTKSKETMKKAYIYARSKVENRGQNEEEDGLGEGSASAIVVNGERLVIASMGNYRVVVCRDGEARQISSKRQKLHKRHWPHTIFSVQKRRREGPNLVIGGEKIDSETEFVILGSNGIWEVMKDQEAVSLIGHIDDAQAAADCLANEALTRMSKSFISCIVIRFD